MMTAGAVYAAPVTIIKFTADQTSYVSKPSNIEPVKLTLINEGNHIVSLPYSDAYYIKNVDTGRMIDPNYGSYFPMSLVDIKPGEHVTFTWNHEDESGALVPDGVYCGVVTLYIPKKATYESQHFTILPPNIGKKQFSGTSRSGGSKPVVARLTVPPSTSFPAITSLSPDHGPLGGGNQVTIMGSNFEPGRTTIDFGSNGIFVPQSEQNGASSFIVTAPPSQKSGDVEVTVTTDVGKSNAIKYTYDFEDDIMTKEGVFLHNIPNFTFTTPVPKVTETV